ncbi:MAG TPA: 50S ribosomal protein L25 [Aggregatilineaceae bacterium]|nr:50S ribosomal protein L25 [Aggregatilineaceae bacterium]
MAERITLEASKRQVTGKAVRHLRSQGIVPGVVYGPTFDNVDIQMVWTDLRQVLMEAGGTQLIELAVDGEKYNTLVRHVQRRPIRGDVMHIDFYRVRMDVAIRTEIPIVLIGEARSLETSGGMLIHEKSTVEVECLPGDLPSEIRVDVSALLQIGDHLLASELPQLPGVTYLIDPDAVLVTTASIQQYDAAEGEEGAPSEPELIRGREEEDEE